MKKGICIILLVALFCSLLFGCRSSAEDEEYTPFASEADFKKTVQGHLWIDHITNDSSAIYLNICEFDDTSCKEYRFTYDREKTLKDMFVQMLEELSNKGSRTEYDDFYDFISNHPKVEGFTYLYHNIDYDYENIAVNSDSSANWYFGLPNKMAYNEQTYYDDSIDSASLKSLEQAFEQAYKSFAEDRISQKYPYAVSHKDVRYDPYGYLGKNFLISGRAELDDYFNYEYADMEHVYFCICIRPEGGSYTDQWYIYAERSKYGDLFEKLKKNSISNITLVCQARYADATSRSLASLVDYIIG